MSINIDNHSLPARQSIYNPGFSIVEVLIALIILAIGLLALAGLQMTGLRANNSAYLLSQATFSSYDILDRMRANRSHAQNGSYNIVIEFDENDDIIDKAEQELGGAGIAGIVYDDLYEWIAFLGGSLPGLREVSVNVNNGIITVEIQWNQSREEPDDDSDLSTIRTQSQL